MRTVINTIVINDNKLLLVKKKEIWILPGGKIEPGESELECIARELSEELSGTKVKDHNYYKNFSGITPHSEKQINIKTYFAKLDGKLYGPSQEIKDVKYIRDFDNYNISNITKDVISSLQKDNYLKK